MRCVERLAARWSFGPGVTVLDGGTQGLYLLPFLEAADRLIVFDAVDYGLVPGTMKIVEDEAVPAFMGAKKMSLHQTGFQDVIATAQLMGYCPEHLLLIGCQPEELARLRDWGVEMRPGMSDATYLADPSIRQDAYEAGRPSADVACRVGDARFFPGEG